MASKSSRRRKRAARRGPATPSPSAQAHDVADGHLNGHGDGHTGVIAPAAPVGVVARAQEFLVRVTAPVPLSDDPDPATTHNTDTVGTDTVGTDTVGTDTVGSDTVGHVSDAHDPAVPGGPVEIVNSEASVTADASGSDNLDDPAGAATSAVATAGTKSWGLGDAIGGWAVAQVASVLAVAAVITTLGYPTVVGVGGAIGQAAGQARVDATINVLNVWGELPIEWQVLLQVPLWLGLIGAPVWAARRKGISLRHDFGLTMVRSDVPVGLVIGVACQLVLVPLVYVPFRLLGGDSSDVSEPAQQLVAGAVSPIGVILLLAVVGIGAPFAEELFYRGLLLRSLLNRMGRPAWAIVLSSMFFAFAHMQSLQFPALVMVGVVFGVLAWRSKRLGLSMFAHVGFNLTTAVVFLFDLTLPYT